MLFSHYPQREKRGGVFTFQSEREEVRERDSWDSGRLLLKEKAAVLATAENHVHPPSAIQRGRRETEEGRCSWPSNKPSFALLGPPFGGRYGESSGVASEHESISRKPASLRRAITVQDALNPSLLKCLRNRKKGKTATRYKVAAATVQKKRFIHPTRNTHM